jgi:hypothetical protein
VSLQHTEQHDCHMAACASSVLVGDGSCSQWLCSLAELHKTLVSVCGWGLGLLHVCVGRVTAHLLSLAILQYECCCAFNGILLIF